MISTLLLVGRDLADEPQDVAHRLALADDHLLEVVAALELLAQHLAFPGELAVLEEAADLAEHVLEDERLQDVVVRTAAQRFDRGLDRRVRRDEQHERLRSDLAHPAKNRETVGAGHAQIGDDDVVDLVREGAEGLEPVSRGIDLVTFVAQHPCEGLAARALVVGEEDPTLAGSDAPRSVGPAGLVATFQDRLAHGSSSLLECRELRF